MISNDTHGSYTMRELLFASAKNSATSGFLKFDDYIDAYAGLIAKQLKPDELNSLLTNINATRESASANRSGFVGYQPCSAVAISSNQDAKTAHRVNAERLAHHDARYFLLPVVVAHDFREPPNVMEYQHALRVRGTFTSETSKTKLGDILEKNRSLLIFLSDFTRAAEAPGKINARASNAEPANPANHTRPFPKMVRTQALLGDKPPPAIFSWGDVVRSAPLSAVEEMDLLTKLATVEAFFAGNDYVEKTVAELRQKYADEKSGVFLKGAVEQAEALLAAAEEKEATAEKAADRKKLATEKAAKKKRADSEKAAKLKKKKKKKKDSSDDSESDSDSDGSSSEDDKPEKKRAKTHEDRLISFFGSYTAQQEAGDDEAGEIGALKRKIKLEDRLLQREHNEFPVEWHPRLLELREFRSEQLVLMGEMEIGFRDVACGSAEESACKLSIKQFELQAGKTQEEMDRYQSAYELHLSGKSMLYCRAYLQSYRDTVSRLSESDKFHKKLCVKAEKKAKELEKSELAASSLRAQQLMTETLQGFVSGRATGVSSGFASGGSGLGMANPHAPSRQMDREFEIVDSKRLCKCIEASFYDKSYSGMLAPPLNFFSTHPTSDYDLPGKGIDLRPFAGMCQLCGQIGHRMNDCGINNTPDTFMRDGKKVLTFRYLHSQKKISGKGKML